MENGRLAVVTVTHGNWLKATPKLDQNSVYALADGGEWLKE